MLTDIGQPIDTLEDLTSSEWDNLKGWESQSLWYLSTWSQGGCGDSPWGTPARRRSEGGGCLRRGG